MGHLNTLISDLALILVVAGVTTLLFKWLKQPVVLGYIVAGFLVGPHFSFFPTVSDLANINIWSEIGIIVRYCCRHDAFRICGRSNTSFYIPR